MARPIYLRPAPQQVAQPGPLLSPAVRVPVLPTHVGQHQPVQQPVKVQQISQPQVTTVYRPTGQLKSSARAPVKVSRPSSLPRAPSAATLPASQAPAAETSPSPPSGSSEQPEILVEGQVTNIGRICLQVGAPIGEGAYAKVFAARLVDSPSGDEDVAIKEMLCGEGPGILPDASVQRATFEVQSMQRLAALFDGESAPLGSLMHAPRVLDHQFWHLGPSENGSGDGAFLCRIAMTRFPGQPLVAFLEEFEAAAASSSSHRLVRRSAASTSSYSEGTEEDAQAYCASFVRAALAVRELLAQVGPTLAKLNSDIAIHRDVNARNILIHVSENGNLDASDGSTSCSGVDVCMAPNSGQLHFMLVDFGSSTDRAAWHCGGGPGSWQDENPTGDARYWGPASWVRFLGGIDGLISDEAFTRAYSRRLDLFALAVCALEALARLQCGEFSSEACRFPSRGSSFELGLASLVHRMHSSWSAYWSVAVHYFNRLADYSQLVCHGDNQGARAVWDELVGSMVPQTLVQRLRALREDMSRLAEHCLSYSGDQRKCAYKEAGRTVEALREMIDENSTLEWPELAVRVCPPQRNGQEPDASRDGQFGASTPPVSGLASAEARQTNVHDGNSIAAAAIKAVAPVSSVTERPAASASAAADVTPVEAERRTNASGEDTFSHPQLMTTYGTSSSLPAPPEHARSRSSDEHPEPAGDRDLEALRILRQVETEVRSLKHWYTEAIEAMRASAAAVEHSSSTRAAPRCSKPFAYNGARS